MKKSRFLGLFLSVVLVLAMFTVNAAAAKRTLATDSTASITVKSAVENDVLAAYKVVDITYNDTNNTLTYAWNSNFAAYFSGTTPYNAIAYEVKEFSGLTTDSAELKALLSNLPGYIAANSIAPVATQTVTNSGEAVFSDLAIGEYFIKPTSSTSVYQLMLQKLEPTVEDNKYVIDDVEFNAKHKEVNVTKAADKTSVTKNEKVKYTVTVEIPTYAASAKNKAFNIVDTLEDGLTLDTASITVTIDGVAVDAANYTLTSDTNSFTLAVDNAKYEAFWNVNSGKTLTIVYEATLNDNATSAVKTIEKNTATYTYSFYPFTDSSTNSKTAFVDVTTFGIKIDKFKNGEPATKLKGAEFALYRTPVDGETAPTVTIPNSSIQGYLLEKDITTDDNGIAKFDKYEANGTKYTYYLVETKAPSGYNLMTTNKNISFVDSDVDAEGYITVEVPNESGFQLPTTGGSGTVIFTVIGIVLMAGAVIVLAVSRKKARK